MHVRAVDSSVAAGTPARATLQVGGMIRTPDINAARLVLDLGVALEAEIGVALDQ